MQVKVKIADAEAIRRTGEAQADVVLWRPNAEAEGLTQKFAALAQMDDSVRAHEEFRLELDNTHTENLKAIDANAEIAEKQAGVFSEALREANIDIVGGDGQFVDSFTKALAIGKAVDGAVSKSDTLKASIAKLLAMGGDDVSIEHMVAAVKQLARRGPGLSESSETTGGSDAQG